MRLVSVTGAVHFADERMQKIGLLASERLFLDLYCLQSGQAQRVHSHGDSDKIYYVLHGRATIQVGAEERELLAGTAVLAPAGEPHGVANRSGDPLTLLVFMAPPPAHAAPPGGLPTDRVGG